MPRRRRYHAVHRALRNGAVTAISLLAFSTLACSGNGGPSTGPPTDVELQQQVADLEARLLAAEKRAIVGEVESARLRRRVHDLEEQLATAQRRGSPPRAEASTPSSSSPTGRPSDSGRTPSFPASRPSSAEQAQKAPDAALPTDAGIEEEDLEEVIPVESTPAPRPGSPEPGSSEESPAEAPASTAASSDGPNTLQPPDDATFAAYDAAYVLFHEKRYREAERQFVTFVSRYPNSELTDNAQFWIGESRYARQDYQGALEAFSTTVANYPGGNKVPDAMLKAGKSLEALGRQDQARQTYLEIQRRFPETAVALAAQEQLAGLD